MFIYDYRSILIAHCRRIRVGQLFIMKKPLYTSKTLVTQQHILTNISVKKN
jgi:hypothetical protein